MERKTISVTGMSCNGCEQTVENALQTLEGVTRVDADSEGDTVELVRPSLSPAKGPGVGAFSSRSVPK